MGDQRIKGEIIKGNPSQYVKLNIGGKNFLKKGVIHMNHILNTNEIKVQQVILLKNFCRLFVLHYN
jgi:sensor c-di-GMP phosphodiesterase-like protein